MHHIRQRVDLDTSSEGEYACQLKVMHNHNLSGGALEGNIFGNRNLPGTLKGNTIFVFSLVFQDTFKQDGLITTYLLFYYVRCELILCKHRLIDLAAVCCHGDTTKVFNVTKG